jgi:hypothetical protein
MRRQWNAELPRPRFGARVVQVKVDFQSVHWVFQGYAVFGCNRFITLFAVIASVNHGVCTSGYTVQFIQQAGCTVWHTWNFRKSAP